MDGLSEDEICRFRPPKSVQEQDSLVVQSLEEKLEDLGRLFLNYWLTKFVQEVANKNEFHCKRKCKQ